MVSKRCKLAGQELAKCRWKKHNKKKAVAKGSANKAAIKAKKAGKLKAVQDAQKKKNKAMQGVSSTAGSTIPMDDKVARAQMLVLPGMKVNKPPDKDPTKRLRKAMGL